MTAKTTTSNNQPSNNAPMHLSVFPASFNSAPQPRREPSKATFKANRKQGQAWEFQDYYALLGPALV